MQRYTIISSVRLILQTKYDGMPYRRFQRKVRKGRRGFAEKKTVSLAHSALKRRFIDEIYNDYCINFSNV
jgi:hypothetical protein